MNIPSHTLIEAGSHNKEAHKILDKGMMLASFANYEQEIPERPAFVAEPQPDHIDMGLDAVEVTDEMAAPRRFEEEYAMIGGEKVVLGIHCVMQGTNNKSSFLTAEVVLYFRRCARQLIHDGTYTGAEACWVMCMGEALVHPR